MQEKRAFLYCHIGLSLTQVLHFIKTLTYDLQKGNHVHYGVLL